jgi:hypothetical protein
MKSHISVDANTASSTITTGKAHDAKLMDRLIREDDRAVYRNTCYASNEMKPAAKDGGVLWAVN